mmetsp:Transcript_132836/g.283858  ORF Transcript_132836/g.283858 Transcript_132836/m.283858 type:complete len:230 (+) Transcript_132836:597-1286(+)
MAWSSAHGVTGAWVPSRGEHKADSNCRGERVAGDNCRGEGTAPRGSCSRLNPERCCGVAAAGEPIAEAAVHTGVPITTPSCQVWWRAPLRRIRGGRGLNAEGDGRGCSLPLVLIAAAAKPSRWTTSPRGRCNFLSWALPRRPCSSSRRRAMPCPRRSSWRSCASHRKPHSLRNCWSSSRSTRRQASAARSWSCEAPPGGGSKSLPFADGCGIGFGSISYMYLPPTKLIA